MNSSRTTEPMVMATTARTRVDWQGLIRTLLAESPAVPLSAAVVSRLGRSLRRAEYAALIRAAHRLAARGELGLVRVFAPDCRSQHNVRLYVVRRDAVDRLRDAGAPVVVAVPNGTVSTSASMPGRRLRGSLRYIAAVLGESKSTVWRHIRDLKNKGVDVDELG